MNPLMPVSDTRSGPPTNPPRSSSAASGNNTDSPAAPGFSRLYGQMQQPADSGKSGGNSGDNLPESAADIAATNPLDTSSLNTKALLERAANPAAGASDQALDNAASSPAEEDSANFPAAGELLQQIRMGLGKSAASGQNENADKPDADDETSTDETASDALLATGLSSGAAALSLPAQPDMNRSPATDSANPSAQTAVNMTTVNLKGTSSDTAANTETTGAAALATGTDNNLLNSDATTSQDSANRSSTASLSPSSAHITTLNTQGRSENIQPPVTATTAPLQSNIPGDRLQMDQDQSQWGQQLGSRVLTLIGKDIQEARIHLDPPELGALEIRMTIDQQDQAKIQIHAQHPQVRDVLEAQSQRLRDALAQQGLNLSEFNVSDQSQQQAGSRSGGQGQAGQAGENDDAVNTSRDTETVAVRQHQGLVSAYA
jgi:flagellar hook-length control protein FliK